MAEHPLTRDQAERLERAIRRNLDGAACGCVAPAECPSHTWANNPDMMLRLLSVYWDWGRFFRAEFRYDEGDPMNNAL